MEMIQPFTSEMGTMNSTTFNRFIKMCVSVYVRKYMYICIYELECENCEITCVAQLFCSQNSFSLRFSAFGQGVTCDF